MTKKFESVEPSNAPVMEDSAVIISQNVISLLRSAKGKQKDILLEAIANYAAGQDVALTGVKGCAWALIKHYMDNVKM